MNRILWKGVLLALLATVIGASACTSLLGSFEVGAGGSAGSGGSGGEAGSGGSLTCESEACCSAADCAASPTECVLVSCESGACVSANAAAGTVVTRQIAGDCKQIQCDGGGLESELELAADVMDDGSECTLDTCNGGRPLHGNLEAGLPCPVTAGHVCDGNGACVECTEASQCPSQVCGAAGACLAASCADAVQNGDETAVDCGGACNGCDVDQPCGSGGDCYHGVCGPDGLCAAPSCDDGVQNGGLYLANQGETAVDCGGPCGATCGPLLGCKVDDDCLGAECSGALCVPNCADASQDNDESDIDCGGMCGPCDNGQGCAAAADCTSGSCADTVCCDAACSGECSACTAAIKGGGVDGECGAVAAGSDPEDECEPAAAATCGDSDGFCSGLAGCTKHPAGTLCGDAPACSLGAQTNQDTCSGSGACLDEGTTPCAPYACGATACKSQCAVAADCAANAFCSLGACLFKQPLGGACLTAAGCTSGFCTDGVCCNNACAAVCQACTAAKSGAADGTCANVISATDPDAECLGANTCNGAGACTKLANGTACGQGAECTSGFCTDGVCCNNACGSLCQACSAAKKGSGSNGSCGNVAANSDPDAECATECNGAAACEVANGSACTLATQCQSGSCSDGFCCNLACGGLCQACSAAKTGAANGTCGNVTAATDPDVECSGNTTCNGAGACATLANGAVCASGAECTSTFCVDGVCCGSACTFTCTACSAAKTGAASGTCANVSAATDPDVECIGATNCNGAGACGLLANGAICTLAGECSSGFCADGVCCNSACGASCQACTAAKKGSGASGTCGSIAANSDPDAECATECNGAGACEVANGSLCTLASQCQSGFCADGVCCNVACGGLCQACTAAKTGAATGTCNNVSAGTDPDNECAAGTPNCAAGGICGP